MRGALRKILIRLRHSKWIRRYLFRKERNSDYARNVRNRNMSKLTLQDVTNIDSITTINSNFDKIEQELQNKVLYRNNPAGEPNSFQTAFDLNGKDILNAGKIYTADGSAFASANQILVVQNEVEVDRAEVADNKDIVLAAKTDTLAAKDLAVAAYDSFDDKYLGVKSADPALDNDGNSLTIGALYFNDQAPKQMKVYNGSAWQAVATFNTTITTSIDASLYPSQIEAEQALNNTKVMTPLRTAQAVAANTGLVHTTGTETIAGVKTFSSPPIGVSGTLIKVNRYTTGTGVTFTPDAKTKSVIIDIVGAGGNSGAAVANSAGYMSYAFPGGGGGRMVCRLLTGFSGGKITIGTPGNETKFEDSTLTKKIAVPSGPEGTSSVSFNTYPTIIERAGPVATPSIGSISGFVLGTEYEILWFEDGEIPATGIAMSASFWCVPSAPTRGGNVGGLGWIVPEDYYTFDDLIGGGLNARGTGGSGLSWSKSTSRSPQAGKNGQMYIYEYS